MGAITVVVSRQLLFQMLLFDTADGVYDLDISKVELTGLQNDLKMVLTSKKFPTVEHGEDPEIYRPIFRHESDKLISWGFEEDADEEPS